MDMTEQSSNTLFCNIMDEHDDHEPVKRRMFLLPKRFSYLMLLIPLTILFKNEKHLQATWRDAEALERRLLAVPQLDFELSPRVQNINQTNQTSVYSNVINSSSTTVSSTAKTNNDRSPSLRGQKDSIACSCEKDLASMYCCQRAMIVVHKMGVTAAEEMRDSYFFNIVGTPQIMQGHRYGQLFEAAFERPVMDYRHTVITRNWYDAIVSGYLYHKSGRECWLDWFGNKGHQGWLLHNKLEDWEKRLLSDPATMAQNLPWRPGNGRDLCTYLAEEPEEMGLRVYSAWAMTSFMNPLLDFRQRRLEMEKEKGWNRTTFLCFEQLMSPTGHAEAVNSLYEWFFPSKRFNKVPPKEEKYEGGHATDRSPTLRKHLMELVSQIDAQYFHGSIAQGSSIFQCGGDLSRSTNVAVTN